MNSAYLDKGRQRDVNNASCLRRLYLSAVLRPNLHRSLQYKHQLAQYGTLFVSGSSSVTKMCSYKHICQSFRFSELKRRQCRKNTNLIELHLVGEMSCHFTLQTLTVRCASLPKAFHHFTSRHLARGSQHHRNLLMTKAHGVT